MNQVWRSVWFTITTDAIGSSPSRLMKVRSTSWKTTIARLLARSGSASTSRDTPRLPRVWSRSRQPFIGAPSQRRTFWDSMRASSSSSERGQSFFNSWESARSASSLPPVWQVAQ